MGTSSAQLLPRLNCRRLAIIIDTPAEFTGEYTAVGTTTVATTHTAVVTTTVATTRTAVVTTAVATIVAGNVVVFR
jgi:hypothetical protein